MLGPTLLRRFSPSRLLLGICLTSLYPGALVPSCQGSSSSSAFDVSLSTSTFARDCVGRENEKLFVLSFDDGPHEYTEPIMDVLKEKGNVPATFFVICSQFDNWPESKTEKFEALIQRMLTEGHTLANHGIDNDEFTLDDVEACHDKIKSIAGGYGMQYFRPAQGLYTIEKYEELIERDYKMVMWNLDIQDWKAEKSPEAMLEEVKMAVQNSTNLPPVSDKANFGLPRRGSYIMLAHDNQDKVLQIVPGGQTLLAAMIDEIRGAGYQIVSVEECLGDAVPIYGDNGNYCGTDFSDAQRCDAAEQCPSGVDSDCPDGTYCFGDVICSSQSASKQNSSPSDKIYVGLMVFALVAACSLAHL